MRTTAMDTAATYLRHVAEPYGQHYADCVSRFQVGFLADGVCRDADTAFAKAVKTCERLLPAIKARTA